MSFDISKYREMFLEEAEELFESADNVLLEAENNGTLTDEEMGQLFRDVHTLKGSGASVELALFAEFTHDVENLMDKLRNHKIEFIPEMAETLIDGLDVMKELLDLEVADKLDRETFTNMTSSLLEEIRAYSNGTAVKKVEVEVSKPIVEEPKIVEVKKEAPVVLDSDNFGFFDDDLNDQRDNKTKAYGIFADDEIDEVHQNIGFYDEDLETISNNTKDSDFKVSTEEKEHFGFFDDVPELSVNSVMETNEIKEEVEVKKTVSIEEDSSVEKSAIARKPRQKEEDEDSASKKSGSNNNSKIGRAHV